MDGLSAAGQKQRHRREAVLQAFPLPVNGSGASADSVKTGSSGVQHWRKVVALSAGGLAHPPTERAEQSYALSAARVLARNASLCSSFSAVLRASTVYSPEETCSLRAETFS